MAKEKDLVKGRWTQEETKLLKKLYMQVRPEEVSQRLGRSIRSTRGKANRLGIKSQGYFWSKEEVKKLRELFPYYDTMTVADKIGRTLSSTINKAYKIRLKKKIRN